MPLDRAIGFQERDLASLRIRIASPRPISAPVCIGMVTEIFCASCQRVKWACLAIFDEALGLEKAHKLAGPDLRHPRHQGIPTVNSSTCCWIASRMFRLASSMVLPLLKQPAGVGL